MARTTLTEIELREAHRESAMSQPSDRSPSDPMGSIRDANPENSPFPRPGDGGTSKLVKFTMTIDRCEHGQNVTQMEDQSLVINDDGQIEENEHQLVVSNADDLVQVSSRGVIAEYQGKEWADKPELGIIAAGPDRIEEEEDHYIERGFDPEGDDPIGADE